ncbi:MAG TPA: BTAD domain-containing putative transcriptional regulator [Gemmatimonadales bacterium]|nr:BTAD domain-containing putative transcriptional regulator [Gemmatimonadales bacterium]
MLRLLTFGGLALEVDGSLVTGALTQRRRMAILALLAAARERGVARDRLLALLWPERDAERAGHVLTQLLYAQRRDAEVANLFLGTKTLRLNPEAMTSDVAQFEAALEAGDGETALRLYRGPFLDGFHLGDAPGFEEWLDRERRRHAERAREAAERLARTAAAGGDGPAAVGWWRRAVEIDPYSAGHALALAEALHAAGDRAAALRELTAYGDRLRRDLELDPEPEVTQLAARLRAT